VANAYTIRKLSAQYPTDLPAWKKLAAHYRDDMRERQLRDLFSRDKQRAKKFALTAGDLTLDYSKNHLNATTRRLLTQLAKQAKVPAAIEAMFAGDKINKTEDRAVLHVALRAKIADGVAHDTADIADVWKVLTKMESFVDDVHAGKIKGSTGKRLTDIVNIGIGGSDLGPVMASRALRSCWIDGMRFHSVSNVDGSQLQDLKNELDAETTLFVICSKTFTTLETMTNARAARAWVVDEFAATFVSASGIGSVAAIHCGRRSVCHWPWSLAWTYSDPCLRVAAAWISIFDRRHWTRTCRSYSPCLVFGEIISTACRARQYCPMTISSIASRLIYNSCKWNRAARASGLTANECDAIPA
jgi:hypothetical protein